MNFNPDNFLQEANRSYSVDHQNQRYGQFMMNYLWNHHPDLYTQVPDDADCFYLDFKFNDFVNWIYSQGN